MYRQLIVSSSRIFAVQSRSISVSPTILAEKLDPIQQLFVDKIREYSQKEKAQKTTLVDATDATKKALEDERARIANLFGMASEQEAMKFPAFKFDSPNIEKQISTKAE